MAERCERVIAIEIQKELIIIPLQRFRGLPKNLEILIADARLIPFPDYVSAGVCSCVIARIFNSMQTVEGNWSA